MTDENAQQIAADPRFEALVTRRGRFAWTLSAAVLVVYFGFILLVAFDKDRLAAPLGVGVTSVGIVVGLGIIVFAIALTAVYVHRANGRYDAELAALIADHAA